VNLDKKFVLSFKGALDGYVRACLRRFGFDAIELFGCGCVFCVEESLLMLN